MKKFKQTLLFTSIFVLMMSFISIDVLANEQPHEVNVADLVFVPGDNWSSAGYGDIKINTNLSGQKIRVKVDGQLQQFDKGITVHATGKVTYDVREYSNQYPYFVAKLGIDASKIPNGNVKFIIQVSKDEGRTWIEVDRTKAVGSNDNAIDVYAPIKDAQYLRIVFDSNGDNGYDHSVMVDAKLVDENYIPNVETAYPTIKHPYIYDAELSFRTLEENIQNHKSDILKSEFVKRIGYSTLQDFVANNPDAKEKLDWLITNEDNLQLVIDAGEIGRVNDFLNSYVRLYDAYQKLPNNENNLVYKKMMIAAAVAYSSDAVASPFTYSTSGKPTYDIVERYNIMVDLFNNDKFYKPSDFKYYHMEHFRMIMADSLKNDELVWMNEYVRYRYPDNNLNRLDPYRYMGYRYGNYNNDIYFSANNKTKFDEKYKLTQYGVPYGYDSNNQKIQRTWITFEEGGICWNISRVGQNLHKTFGIPVVGVFQPGHEAYINLTYDANGVGSWNIGNDVAGWGQSCSAAGGGGKTYRYLFGWNNKDYTPVVGCGKGLDDAAYLILGQAVLNDLSSYEASNAYILLANSLDSSAKRKEAYIKAIEAQNINIDGYEGLIKIMKAEGAASEEWKTLSDQIYKVYKYHLTALNDMFRLIRPHLSAQDKVIQDMNFIDAIHDAAKVKDNERWQGRAIRQIGEFMINKDQKVLAKFSFDGEFANIIRINEEYADSRIEIQYSFDDFKTVYTYLIDENAKIVLTDEQLVQINPTDDIKLKISGTNNIFTIDIKNGTDMNTVKLEANDDENRFVGNTNSLEYSTDGGNTWKKNTTETLFEGNVTVKYRFASFGTTLGSETKEANFTENTDLKHQYVPVKHVSLVSAPTHQGGEEASKLIDANPFTMFHTKHGQYSQNRDYIVKFDEPRILSGISYDPRNDSGVNGIFKDVEVYVGLDNQDYQLVGSATNWTTERTRKYLEFDTPQEALYVKVRVPKTHGDGPNNYISGNRLNFYEDLTQIGETTIEYSTTELTNKDVVATIVLPEGFTSDETTYTFTENGSHTFVYRDSRNKEHEIVANVDWIDKVIPTATVSYNINEATTGEVIASLVDISEEVTFISKDLNEDNSYTFRENGTYNFVIEDKAGNQATITAIVSWIDKTAPTAKVNYSNSEATNQDVVAYLSDISEEVTFISEGLNEDHSYTFVDNGNYDFIIQDLAGNQSTITASVNWIDKVAPTVVVEVITKDDGNQYAIIKESNEPATFMNGSVELLLTDFGTYNIQVKDAVGNITLVEVTVEKQETIKPEQAAPNAEDFMITTKKDSIIVENRNQSNFVSEYSIDGHSWQDSNTFTELNPDSKYTVYVRYKENDTFQASEAIEFTVRTKKLPIILEVGELKAIEGNRLHNLSLNYGWRWLSENSTLIPGKHTYQIVLDNLDVDTDYEGVNGYNPETNNIVRDIKVVVEKKPNIPPVIKAENITLTVGDEFNILDYISASDNEDGEIKLTVDNIIENTVDINTPGTYKVVIEVRDSEGEKASKTIMVTVNPKPVVPTPTPDPTPTPTPTPTPNPSPSPETTPDPKPDDKPEYKPEYKPDNNSSEIKPNPSNPKPTTKPIVVDEFKKEAPIIDASDITITIGESYDLLKNVKAHDKQDGDITDKIVILNAPEELMVGTYEIIYKVIDNDGNETIKKIILTVIENELFSNENQIENSEEFTIDKNNETLKLENIFISVIGVSLIFGVIVAIVIYKKK